MLRSVAVLGSLEPTLDLSASKEKEEERSVSVSFKRTERYCKEKSSPCAEQHPPGSDS